ncbi:NAD-dependent epimerase/dehydratase family protein [Pseudorhodoferax sp.]|uniref:NAD-dependent epimerase/dehydratase family protein n=1 Tax=Pseudorhodoferax sp. TaxID=1993553 RepID=UPI0039E4061A
MRHGRILVTGGSGFLGQRLAHRLLARGLRVRVMDLPGALPATQGPADPALQWQAGDVRRAEDVRAALAGCDGVAHLAGLLTPACLADPVRGAEVNLIGTLQVFEAARAQGLDRVVYASTAGVYGPEPGHPLPVTHYGAFKLAAEGAARASWHAHGLASVGLRPYVVYGPERAQGVSAGPSLACCAAALGQPCTIGYTGAAGLVYVDDVARAFEHALLDAPARGAQVFNLAGTVHTVDEVIAEIRRQVPGARLDAAGPPLGIAPDIGEDGLDAWFPDRPRTTLADGIAATLAHYRNQGAHP